MTATPDWMLRSGDGLTTAAYGTLPEEIRRRIEIIDGCVAVVPAPQRGNKRIARRLATALEAAAPGSFTAEVGVDLRLRDVPLLLRRPSVVVFDASLADDAVLRPKHCVLAVEVLPLGATAEGRSAEYAAFGIRHFWRVETDGEEINVFRYQLDPTTRTYGLAGLDKDKLSVRDPVELTLDLETLR